MLFIHSGLDSRDRLSAKQAQVARQALHKLGIGNLKEDRPVMLNAAFTVYSAKLGCLLVACLDELTNAWYKQQVANLELEGQAVRA